MSQHKCEDCKFWEEEGDGQGWCLRYPPVAITNEQSGVVNLVNNWPLTMEDGWCGEFKAKSPNE